MELAALSRRQYLLSASSIAAATLIPTQPSHAAGLNYQGIYTDPKNPKGYKVLIGDSNKATLQFQNDSSDQMHEIPVDIGSVNDGTQFTFDYSIIGISNEIGTFSKDKEGIPLLVFADNTWKKRETGPIGVYYDNSNLKKRIVIRQVKGAEWNVNVINGEVSVEFSAKAGNPIMFRMPNGEKNDVFNMKDKTITFDDGNMWNKF